MRRLNGLSLYLWLVLPELGDKISYRHICVVHWGKSGLYKPKLCLDRTTDKHKASHGDIVRFLSTYTLYTLILLYPTYLPAQDAP